MSKVAASPASFVRTELRALHPYTLEQTECRFKLDQNEVPWDFPARLKRRALTSRKFPSEGCTSRPRSESIASHCARRATSSRIRRVAA